jgi:hypothetical protein
VLSKPLREMTLAEVIAECSDHRRTPLPGLDVARAALHAKVRIAHPGNAPPEPRDIPSRALADFVLSRDLTCCFPHCGVPANRCDIDYRIAYGHGPTRASNLKWLGSFHV